MIPSRHYTGQKFIIYKRCSFDVLFDYKIVYISRLTVVEEGVRMKPAFIVGNDFGENGSNYQTGASVGLLYCGIISP